MKVRIALLGAAAGLLLSLGAGTARADHRDDCWKRINKAEHNLQKAVRNHGWGSRQADKRRAELRRAQSRCGEFGFFGGRNDGRWNRGRDRRDRDDWRDRDRRDSRWNRGRDDNYWNHGRRDPVGSLLWFWSSDGRRHRHSRNGAWCNLRH